MANVVKIPYLNPVKFYKTERVYPLGKNQYFLNEEWFKDQIPTWYERTRYYQKWQRTDIIYLQVQANFGPVDWQVIDCKGIVMLSGTFNAMLDVPPGQIYTYYDASIQMADSAFTNANGAMYIVLNFGRMGNTILAQWISEPFMVRDRWPETLAHTYTCPKGDYHEIWFNGNNSFTFRCESRLINFQPGSVSKVYTDQTANIVQLSRRPFRQWTLSVGHSYGVPNWVIEGLNNYMACDTYKVDGLAIVPTDGAGWEAKRVDKYPMSGWSIEVQEAVNRYYDYSDSTADELVSIAYNIDGKVTGSFYRQPTGSPVQIISAE